MKTKNEIINNIKGFQITFSKDFKQNSSDRLQDLFSSKSKNEYFDTKSEKKIMELVNQEIKASRKFS